jgi:pilus assembly protein CpaB
MRVRNIAVLAAAVFLGVVAAHGLFEREVEALARPAVSNTVVVAAKSLPFGTELTREHLSEVVWVGASFPNHAFVTRDEILKAGRRQVLAPIGRGELILSGKITEPGRRASRSRIPDQGLKEIVVRVEDLGGDLGAAGSLPAGGRVSVAVIRTSGASSEANSVSYSESVLQEAKVLSVNQIASEGSSQSAVISAVTLQVTPEQANKIMRATKIGKLSISPLGTSEFKGVDQPSAKRQSEASRPLGETSPQPAETTPQPAEDKKRQLGGVATATVEVIRGARRTTHTVSRTD